MDPRMLTVLALCAIAISALPHSAHPDEVVAEGGSEPFPSAELVSKQWQAQPQQTSQPIKLAPGAVSALRKAPNVAVRDTLAPMPLAKTARLHKVIERGALLGTGQVVSNQLPAQSQSQRKLPIMRPATNINSLRKASKVAIRDTLAPKSLAKPAAAAPWLRKVAKRGALIGTAAAQSQDCSACFFNTQTCHPAFISETCLQDFDKECSAECHAKCDGNESGACCAYNALNGDCEPHQFDHEEDPDEARVSCVLDECNSERQSINSIREKATATKNMLLYGVKDGTAKALLTGMDFIIGQEADRLKEEARYQDQIESLKRNGDRTELNKVSTKTASTTTATATELNKEVSTTTDSTTPATVTELNKEVSTTTDSTTPSPSAHP